MDGQMEQAESKQVMPDAQGSWPRDGSEVTDPLRAFAVVGTRRLLPAVLEVDERSHGHCTFQLDMVHRG
jgi:hypothetical protein